MEFDAESIGTSSEVARRLERDVDELWEQLTSPEGFEQWMGPGSSIDAKPDGELIAADPESGEPKIGRVLEVEPGRRLSWVWRPLGDETTTEVVVVVEPGQSGDHPSTRPGTLITVTERPTSLSVTGVRAQALVMSAG